MTAVKITNPCTDDNMLGNLSLAIKMTNTVKTIKFIIAILDIAIWVTLF